ncbi:ribonuclease P, partial [Candidatus Woesearchaeota archaeon]|nr:ribonuclease P [Candidatus Woesearchaeota archaeon]
MKKLHSKKQSEMKQIAKDRIQYLFEQAELKFSKNPSLSNRYVTLARKLAMKYKIRMPRELKRKFCKHCYKYLVPGKNCRVRTHNGKVVYSCFNCKKFMRFVCKP